MDSLNGYLILIPFGWNHVISLRPKMKKNKIIFLILCLFGFGELGAEPDIEIPPEIENWKCFDMSDIDEKKSLIILSILPERSDDEWIRSNSGFVSVAGIAHPAFFHVEGFNHRWDFGFDKKTSTYRFSFIIEPDGTGLSFDFGREKTAKPTGVYKCRRIKTKKGVHKKNKKKRTSKKNRHNISEVDND